MDVAFVARMRWTPRSLLVLLAALVALTCAAAPRCQQTPTAPAPSAQQAGGQQAGGQQVSVDTLQQLVQDIQDPAERQKLIERLQALIRAAEEPAPSGAATAPESTLVEKLVAFFRGLSDEASNTIDGVVDQVATVPDRLRALQARLANPEQRAALLTQTGLSAAIAAAAIAGYLLVWFLLGRVRALLGRHAQDRPLRRLERIGRVTLRLLVDLASPAAALAIAFAGISLIRIDPAGGAIALAVASAVALRGAARALLGAVLAPRTPELRVVPVGDAPASALARSLLRASALGIYGYFAIVAVRALGADAALVDALRSLYAIVLLIVGVTLVLRYRGWPASAADDEPSQEARSDAPTAPSAGSEHEPARSWVSAARAVLGLWWIAALVYMFGLYTLWMSGIQGAFGRALASTGITLGCAAAAIAVYALADAGLRKLGSRLASLAKPLPTIRRRIPRYLSGARIVLGIVVGIVAAGFAFEAWGVGAIEALQSTLLRDVLTTALVVLAIVFLAFATIDVSTAVTESYLRRKQLSNDDTAKLRTLLPLTQKAIKLVVWVLASLTVLGQLGVNLAPVVASIGVLGLAIGFGAQTLVKDIITGVFILLEDAVSVGDIVMIDGTGGLVEAINIRTIRLRDLSGNVHTIPYSTVGQFANLTKEFSCYLIECGVAYREDVDEVIEVLKELGEEMQNDPDFGSKILEPIEIFGLDRFEDSAVIVRARLKTAPSQQWSVGREFNRRMKRTFDERGIEIPFPHRTIYVGEDKQGNSPPLHLAGQDGALAASARNGDAGRERSE